MPDSFPDRAHEVIQGPEGGKNYRSQSQLYVATPAVLEYLGIDPATIDPARTYLVDRSVTANAWSRASTTATPSRTEDRHRQHLFGAESGWTPPYFITLNGLRRHGWKQIPGGWLVQSSRPLTSDQIADARDAAAEAGPRSRPGERATRRRRSWRSRRPQAPSWRSPSSR